MDLSQWAWICTCCGKRKRGVPDYGFAAPIHHDWAEAGAPDCRVLGKTDDFCVMEIEGHRHFFIRCVLRLPVAGTDADFGFGVWSTLSEANYRRYAETFDDEDQSSIGPMFGYLANRLPFYPDPLNLRLDVLPRDGRQRPLLRIRDEHAGHPLHTDQVGGLDAERLAALLSEIIPCDGRA